MTVIMTTLFLFGIVACHSLHGHTNHWKPPAQSRALPALPAVLFSSLSLQHCLSYSLTLHVSLLRWILDSQHGVSLNGPSGRRPHGPASTRSRLLSPSTVHLVTSNDQLRQSTKSVTCFSQFFSLQIFLFSLFSFPFLDFPFSFSEIKLASLTRVGRTVSCREERWPMLFACLIWSACVICLRYGRVQMAIFQLTILLTSLSNHLSCFFLFYLVYKR